MSQAFLLGGARTSVGRYGGAPASVRPDDLAALVVGEAVARAGVPAEAIDEVVLGAADQAGEDNRIVAPMAVLLAGLPDDVPGLTANPAVTSARSGRRMPGTSATRIVNADGGAIARGHPLGSRVSRLLVTLLGRREREGARYGLATMRVGVRQGTAMIVERVDA